jgi:anti-anti-sigma factor
MSAQLQISDRRIGDVAVISLAGWLVPDEADARFAQHIDARVGQGVIRVVVDLHDVSILDSGGIGVLVAKCLALRTRGGDLRLARLTPRTERVLAMTHLLTVFPIFESVDDAVRSFGAATGRTAQAGEDAVHPLRAP